jgi:hypothetical protein
MPAIRAYFWHSGSHSSAFPAVDQPRFDDDYRVAAPRAVKFPDQNREITGRRLNLSRPGLWGPDNDSDEP